MTDARLQPGLVRDAIVAFLHGRESAASVAEIWQGVCSALQQPVPKSSVRSYLNLNATAIFLRTDRGSYQLARERIATPRPLFEPAAPNEAFRFGRAVLFQNDCFDWLRQRAERSVHAVVT